MKLIKYDSLELTIIAHERGVIAGDRYMAWTVLAGLHWTQSQRLSWPRTEKLILAQVSSQSLGRRGRGRAGSVTWCLSRAMAVRVSVDTWREQYCTKRLMWHMAFPKIHVLFTKRT